MQLSNEKVELEELPASERDELEEVLADTHFDMKLSKHNRVLATQCLSVHHVIGVRQRQLDEIRVSIGCNNCSCLCVNSFRKVMIWCAVSCKLYH